MEHKDLMAHLRAAGQLEYGSVIKGDDLRAMLDIKYPERGTKKEFDALALVELSAVNYVRNILLGEGKYLIGVQGDYRILLPSENARQADLLMASADRKMARARRLMANTPAGDNFNPTAYMTARLAMRAHSPRRGLPS